MNIIDFFFRDEFISYKKEGTYCLKLYCNNCYKTNNYDLFKGCEFSGQQTNQHGTFGSKIKVGYWKDRQYTESKNIECKNCGGNSLIRIKRNGRN